MNCLKRSILAQDHVPTNHQILIVIMQQLDQLVNPYFFVFPQNTPFIYTYNINNLIILAPNTPLPPSFTTGTPPGVDLTAASAMSKTMPRMPSTTPRGTPLSNAHTTASSWREGSTGKVVAMATAAAAVEIDDYEYSSSEDEQPVDDVDDDDDDDDDVVDDDLYVYCF